MEKEVITRRLAASDEAVSVTSLIFSIVFFLLPVPLSLLFPRDLPRPLVPSIVSRSLSVLPSFDFLLSSPREAEGRDRGRFA